MFGAWFKLNAFTSGRALWGYAPSSAGGVKLEGSSEIKITTDATTDAVWTSTGAGISTGQWHCLCVLLHSVSSVKFDAAAWISGGYNAPQRLSLTNTVAGASSLASAANSHILLGNTGSGSLLGVDAQFGRAAYFSTLRGSNWPIFSETNGTIDGFTIDSAYRHFVEPLWRGGRHNMALTRANTGAFCLQENDLFTQDVDTDATYIPQYRAYSGSGVVGIQPFYRSYSNPSNWNTMERAASQGSGHLVGHDQRRR